MGDKKKRKSQKKKKAKNPKEEKKKRKKEEKRISDDSCVCWSNTFFDSIPWLITTTHSKSTHYKASWIEVLPHCNLASTSHGFRGSDLQSDEQTNKHPLQNE